MLGSDVSLLNANSTDGAQLSRHEMRRCCRMLIATCPAEPMCVTLRSFLHLGQLLPARRSGQDAAPHRTNDLDRARHYGQLFAPTTAEACLRQQTQPTWPSPAGRRRRSRIWRTACQSAIQHSTGTQSTPQGRPPRYPIPRKTYIRWTRRRTQMVAASSPKACCTTVREFAKYRASCDILSRNSGMPESEQI